MDYYLRKQKYTIYTQGVARYNLIFLDIATGYPGSLHDTRILRSSTLYPVEIFSAGLLNLLMDLVSNL